MPCRLRRLPLQVKHIVRRNLEEILKITSKLALVTLVLFLPSCSFLPERVEFTEEDRHFVFSAADVESHLPDDLEIVKNKYGQDSTYFKSDSKMNGFSALYSQMYICQGKEMSIQVSANVQSSVERAKKLYSSDISRGLNSKDRKKIQPQEYGVDQLFLSIGQDSYYIGLQKGKIVYSVAVEGISLPELEMKRVVLEKVAYLESSSGL